MFKNLCSCLSSESTAVRHNSRRHVRREETNDRQKKEKGAKGKSSFFSVEGGLTMSDTKGLTGSFRQKEGVVFMDENAGDFCDICSSRPKTHFVVPCGHTACLPCWTTWLFNEANAGSTDLQGLTTLARLKQKNPKFSSKNKCFVCQQPVKTIKRFAFSVVPKHPYEVAEDNELLRSTKGNVNSKGNAVDEAKEMESRLEEALERLMRAVLAVKDELRFNIIGKLEETRDHLEALNLTTEYGEEERSGILSVECITVNEAFNNLNELFQMNNPKKIALWVKLTREISSFKMVLQSLKKFLEERKRVLEDGPISPEERAEDEEEIRTEAESTNLSIDVAENENEQEVDQELEEAAVLESKIRLESPLEAERPSLEGIKDTLELALSGAALTAQWDQVQKLLLEASLDKKLVPTVLEFFQGISFEGNLDAEFMMQVMSLADSFKGDVKAAMEEMLSSTLPDLEKNTLYLLENLIN